MEGNQVGSFPDSLIASFKKRIGELQELVIARNMYPATSIPDLSAIDTALSLMDLQVQSIKDGLRKETEAISKPKKLIEEKLQKMPIHINRCLLQENVKQHEQNSVFSSLKSDEEAAVLPKEKKGRASAPLRYITVEELNSLSSLLQENVMQHEQNSVFSSLKSDEEALLGYLLFKLCWDTCYSTFRWDTCYSSSVGAIEEDASSNDSSNEEDASSTDCFNEVYASDSSNLDSISDLNDGDEELQITDDEGITMISPSRFGVLDIMPLGLRRHLKKHVVAVINHESAKDFLEERYKFLLEMGPPQQLSISDSKRKMFIFWKKGKLPVKYLLDEKARKMLKEAAGFIQDQYKHVLCWAFAICDMLSMCRVLYRWDKKFTPLSVLYLCEKVDPDSYDELENPKHRCYGCGIREGLLYIKEHGIPKESPYEKEMREQNKEFDCLEESVVGTDMCYITNIFMYDTLEDALNCLKTPLPVLAGLILFDGWDSPGIYRGPVNGAKYAGEHLVVMTDCTEIDGETVVKCKSSNGLTVGNNGYIFVSAQVMLIEAGSTRKAKYPDRHVCSIKPTYLLSDFYSVEMEMGPNPKRKEKQNKKRRTEQGK